MKVPATSAVPVLLVEDDRQELLASAFEREQALRKAETRESGMLASALDAIITIDHEGTIVEFNPAAEKAFGFPRDQIVGKCLAETLIPHAYREKHRQGVARYLETGEGRILNQRLELAALRADGSQFPVELTITRIPLPGPPMFTAYLRDISDRQLTQQALEERMHLATLTATVGVILTRREDLRGMLQECAEAMFKHLDVALARVWTMNAKDNILELQASAGIYTHLDGPHSRIPVGVLEIGKIAAERSPHLTNEVIGDPHVGDQEWAKREGVVAFAGYPLIVDGRLVGVMALFARRRLGAATLDAMATVADQLAAGIKRKEAEESLRFTQFTIDHVATPVFWAESDGRFFNVNDAACRLTGYTRDELLALTVSDVNPSIPPEKWGEVWSGLRLRGSLAMESNLRRKDGTEIPISVSSNLLEAEGRQFSCTFLQDITERKQAEQAQREGELRFRAIYNQLQLQIRRLPLAHILYDADFRIVDWNPAAERIFGYSKEEMLGMGPPFAKIVPEAFRFRGEELLGRFRAGDMSAHSVNDNLTKDGRTITCEWINTPLEDETGQFSGLLCLAHDVTERKRLEEQSRHAQKMEAVGSLAGGIAHEFNNLLQAISGYTRFAIEGLAPEEQRCQDLELVLNSANRAADLTKQLLSFGRRQILQRVRLDPNQVVNDVAKMLRRLIGENIEIQTHLAPDVAAIDADAGQLQQLLLNLCINARDAMPNGGRLVIRTQNVVLGEAFCEGHRDAKPGPYVVLTVADTGCGMSPEVKARIFEPFFTTKELGKGTGLGLAMVYGMVEQHGGIIHVYSEPGAGTTFRVYLPESSLEPVESSRFLEPKSIGGNETILIAEDDPIVRSFLTRVLQQSGYKTLAASDGHEALRVYKENAETISLAVLDMVMPRLGGRALLHELRKLDPDFRVIFCTGHDPGVNEPEAIQERALPVLQKPIEPALLLQTIRAVLDSNGGDGRTAKARADDDGKRAAGAGVVATTLCGDAAIV